VLEVDREVLLLIQPRRVARVLEVLRGRVLALAADDQRRAGLVDEDRVDLVHDRVAEVPLHELREVAGHVVAQVVEAELVVGAVRDVAAVGLLPGAGAKVLQAGVGMGLVEVLGVVDEGPVLALALRLDHAQRQPEQREDGAHPAGVAASQVVVDGDQVRAPPGERVEVERQRRDQGLALAGLHLRDLALVEDDSPHQLDVVRPQPDRPPCRLADDREGFDQHLLQDLGRTATLLYPRLELVGARAQAGVVEGLEVGLEGGDGLGRAHVLLDLPVVGVDQAGDELHVSLR
jgi:hypothetical protein